MYAKKLDFFTKYQNQEIQILKILKNILIQFTILSQNEKSDRKNRKGKRIS